MKSKKEIVSKKEEDIETVRSYSFSVSSNIKSTNKEMDKRKKKKSFTTYEIKDEIEIMNYLKEQDVLLSKPLIIKNALKPKTKFQKIKNYIDDFEDSGAKQRMTMSFIPEIKRNYTTQEIFLKPNFQKKNVKEEFVSTNSNINLKSLIKTDDENDRASQNILIDTESKKLKSEDTESIIDIYPSIIYSENEKKVDQIFGEKFEDQAKRLRKNSPYGNCNSWKLFKVIVKSGEDLRQEQFATQLISEFYQIFQLEKIDVWLKPYEILSTGHNVGIIECVPNSVSLDYLKRKAKCSLRQFYENYFGGPKSERFTLAIDNFIKSLAGYSLVCYFLQIKDRHNGNILIDDQGHIIHIDFGFMLSNSPGNQMQFEKAPFKLTSEFVELIGGLNSPNFSKFRKLIWKGFIAVSKHHEKIAILIEMMYCGHGYNLPCFIRGHAAIEEVKLRFIPKMNMNKYDYISHSDKLIEKSIDNWRTKWYDKIQYWMQGIFY